MGAATVAIDVTHATDNPDVPEDKRGPVELGAGPVVGRGSANHPTLVSLARSAAADTGIEIQLQAAGTRTGTDADAFYTSRSGIPSLNLIMSVVDGYRSTATPSSGRH